MCFCKGTLIHLNFIVVYSEDEIKGMLEKVKSKEFIKAFSKAFQEER